MTGFNVNNYHQWPITMSSKVIISQRLIKTFVKNYNHNIDSRNEYMLVNEQRR